MHKGSYGKLGQAYNALSAWIEEKELKIAGPQRELYLKGEWDSDSEEEYITEIQIPVVKKGCFVKAEYERVCTFRMHTLYHLQIKFFIRCNSKFNHVYFNSLSHVYSKLYYV